ncbi:hypothetical protein LCGC14_3166060, partial [marine sediment metagenome]
MSKTMENIREYLVLMKEKELKEVLAEVPLPELIEQWDSLSEEEEVKIFTGLTIEQKVDLITSLALSKQEALITSLTGEHLKILLAEMDPDDLTDFIQSVSPEVREAVWNVLGEEAKRETQFLLKFDEDDAAGLMTPRYLALRSSLTVAQALTWVRKSAASIETIYYIYIMDHHIQHNPDIRRPEGIRTDPVCLDEFRLDLKPLHRLHNRVTPLRMSHRNNNIFRPGKLNDSLTLSHRRRQRLLDHHRHAVINKNLRQLKMLHRRSCYRHRIDLTYKI